MHIFVTTAVLITAAFVGGCASRNGASRYDAALRRDLLAMCDVDQKVRENIGSHMSAVAVAEMQAVDARHTSRMRAIVAKHGWPGRSLVGDDGAHAAWLLVQHADSAFMAQCLPVMQHAVAAGQAFEKDYVYLLDRVRMQQGKPQIYGTQFTSAADGKLVLHPIKDAEHVDERRRAVGLPSMAEQERVIREVYR
jgi:hypothetical protein